MSSAWEMISRRKMKSPKFMGKERATGLTKYTHTLCVYTERERERERESIVTLTATIQLKVK
jgi:hypothetical protein